MGGNFCSRNSNKTLEWQTLENCNLRFNHILNWTEFKLNWNLFIFASAEARAEISGPSEKYLKPGSVLRLTCRVVENIENPLYIFWYHNNRMINYDSHRGVNVSTEAGMSAEFLSGLCSVYLLCHDFPHDIRWELDLMRDSRQKTSIEIEVQFVECPKRFFWCLLFYSSETDNRYSELQISQTTTSHSGNYSCVTNNAVSSSTFVHIFNGERQSFWKGIL